MRRITITVDVDGSDVSRSYMLEESESKDWGEIVEDILDSIEKAKVLEDVLDSMEKAKKI